MTVSPPLVSVVLFLSLLLCFLPLSSSRSSVLSRRSSLSVEKAADVLVSPDGTFSCGFLSVGTNAAAFSIWFTASSDQTPVWTANRERPVNGRGSRITLQRDGALVLTDADKSVAWSINTNSTGAATAELLNTGNLVVKDGSGGVLWQSFGSPTHTLLPTQFMTKTTKLVSSISAGTLSSGYYTFYFDNDNVLKMMYDGPEVSSIYWPNPDNNIFQNGRSSYNSSRRAVLDEAGRFTASDQLAFNASDAGAPGVKRRLTLDHDGNLRLYSLNATGRWVVSSQTMTQVCKVHGQCGKNAICELMPEPKCACLPEHEMTDPTNWKLGCKRKVEIACGPHRGPWNFVEIPYTDFYGYDNGFSSNISFETCRKKCVDDCTCLGFVYKRVGSGVCFPKGLLFNGFTSPDFSGVGDSLVVLHKHQQTEEQSNTEKQKSGQTKNKKKLHFIRSAPPAPFVPRAVADVIPFSSKKLPEVFVRFSIGPNSRQADDMKVALGVCERRAGKVETKRCVTSLESMIDFTTSTLGTRSVRAASTVVDNEHAQKQQYYTMAGLETLAEGGKKVVICHVQPFPYAVFFCHATTSVSNAYVVQLVGEDGSKVAAVAVCHKDVSGWHPRHLAFLVLKVKVGTVPICHFLRHDVIVWTPTDWAPSM